MSTRLYPKTHYIPALETMAHVPAGTFAKLEALKVTFSSNPYGDELFGAIRADLNLARLDNFLTFGWGRVRGDVLEALELDPIGGQTNNPLKIKVLLECQHIEDVSPELCGGLCWS